MCASTHKNIESKSDTILLNWMFLLVLSSSYARIDLAVCNSVPTNETLVKRTIKRHSMLHDIPATAENRYFVVVVTIRNDDILIFYYLLVENDHHQHKLIKSPQNILYQQMLCIYSHQSVRDKSWLPTTTYTTIYVIFIFVPIKLPLPTSYRLIEYCARCV